MENPKKAANLFSKSLDSAPAPFAPGTQVPDKLDLAVGGGNGGEDGEQAASLLEFM